MNTVSALISSLNNDILIHPDRFFLFEKLYRLDTGFDHFQDWWTLGNTINIINYKAHTEDINL